MATRGGATRGGTRLRAAARATAPGTIAGIAPLIALLTVLPFLLPSAHADAPAIYLEDSPSAQDEVHRAIALRDEGRFGDAADRLQQVIVEHPYKLMQIEHGLYEDTLSWVRRLIADDAELLSAYRSRFAAQAQRMREEATRPRVDAAKLEQVVARFAVTEPGLIAAMDLAAVHLERADGRGAASVLDELADHPDLAGDNRAHLARYHYLQTVAGLLAGERERATSHRERLEDARLTDRVAAVDDLAGRLDPPEGSAARLRPDALLRAAIGSEQLDAPLWEGEVAWTPLGPASSDLIRRDRSRSGQIVPILPAADERRVYLNQGDRIRALDRDSGWETWTYRWPAITEAGEIRGLTPLRRPRVYERGVAVTRDRVYAVMGAASPWPSRWDQGASITGLVAVDRQHGREIWRLEPAALDAGHADAYFTGTPIVTPDRVLVLVRRSQASGFTDTFLVALSPVDGSLLWRRHIASAAVSRRFQTGPRPRMSAARGLAFVSDSHGAVAAVDQRNGSMRWVRVLVEPPPPGAEADRSGGRRAMQSVASSPDGPAPPPLLIPAGLLVHDPTAGDDGRALLLDPRTGRVRRTLDGEPWTNLRGLKRVDGDLLTVGEGIALLDGQSLEVRWHHDTEGANPASPDGQVAVADDQVFYVVDDELRVLDRVHGELVQRRPVESPANVLPLEDQLVVVGEDRARSFMSWERAGERLRERIAESPEDPEPGMAMAHLALRGGYSDQALEGVDASLGALQRLRFGPRSETPPADAAQQHAFDHLLRLARSEQAASHGIRGNLFNRLATITAGPGQEVAYHLAAAAFLADARRGREAVEHLQAVLGDRTLAGQLHDDGVVSRQAGLEARRRLQDLVESQGRGVYSRYERIAATELRRLEAGPGRIDELIALAEQYPLASTAPRALVIVAERLASRGDLARATQQLRLARDLAHTPEIRADVVARTAWLYEQHDQPRQAIAWLDRLRRQDPDRRLHRDGEAITAEQWIESLRTLTADAGPLPQLTLPFQQPVLLPGRLVELAEYSGAAGAGTAGQSHVLLTEHEGELRRYEIDSFELRWRVARPTSDAELIAVDEDRLLFWSPGSGRLISLDDATGEVQWTSDEASDLLAEVGDAGGREATRHADERRLRRMMEHPPHLRQQQRQQWDDDRPETFLAVGSSTVALADRQGRVVGVDRRTGRVLWRLMTSTELVLQSVVREDRLVLAGINGAGTDAESGALTVLDLLSGEPHLPLIEDRAHPLLVGFTGDDGLAVLTEGQITVYRLATGEVAWRSELDAEATITGGWGDGRMLLLIDQGRSVRMYAADSGRLLRRLDVTQRRGVEPVLGDPVEDQWYLFTPDGLLVIDGEGHTRWRDAISDEDRAIVAYVPTQEHVVLLASRDRGNRAAQVFQGPDGGRIEIQAGQVDDDDEAQLYLLDRRTGALTAEHSVSPLPGRLHAGAVAIRQNRLILPLTSHTVVIPGSE